MLTTGIFSNLQSSDIFISKMENSQDWNKDFFLRNEEKSD